ncbi:sigma 54-interacting transcriptional regulator [Sorangium sp. So ce1036]|uniref:sigma 54-interacting transcriptional regulator n=1 Tax=Sorangium sp. So ce1036 TaxID=3133328 RepID=UPI003F01B024
MELPRDGGTSTTTVLLPGSFIDAIRRVRPAEQCISLLIYHRDGSERVVLRPNTPVVIGRAPPSQVRIQDTSLSREHARFTASGGVITVEDLQSTNGTWVGGARVERAEIRSGDSVMLGSVLVSVRVLTPEESASDVLLTHERFRVILEEEVRRAHYFGRSFAVLMVRPARGAGAHVSRFVARVRALLRPVDRVALYSPDTLAILLTEARPDVATALARAITAPSGDEEIPMLAGVATFPDTASDPEKLLELSWSAARGATLDNAVRSAPAGTWTLGEDAGLPEKGGEPVAVSPEMRHILQMVARVSRSPIPVLLLGETGTGKEVLARAIHERGARQGRPMVCVNCGAIPQQLVESTLFGHERGSFTGASQQQRGVFEVADGGTVFLDEVAELPLPAQAALLRVLETRRITRVGSSREIEVDVRIIAATHRDVEALCASGGFRLDLLYRLNAMTLTIPPLRARPEEIEPLALRFLHQANRANGRSIRGIEPGALELLRAYAWPGNARELRNAIERAVVIAEGEWIVEQDLPERVRAGRPLQVAAAQRTEPDDEPTPAAPEAAAPDAAAQDGTDDLKMRLQRYESQILVEALRAAGWNQREAARALNIPLRTLVHKLKVLGIKKLGYAPTAPR